MVSCARYSLCACMHMCGIAGCMDACWAGESCRRRLVHMPWPASRGGWMTRLHVRHRKRCRLDLRKPACTHACMAAAALSPMHLHVGRALARVLQYGSHETKAWLASRGPNALYLHEVSQPDLRGTQRAAVYPCLVSAADEVPPACLTTHRRDDAMQSSGERRTTDVPP